MKYLLRVAFAFAICTTNAAELWEMTNFSAVTEFEGIADYYRSLAPQKFRVTGTAIPTQPLEPDEQWKKVRMKTDICESIFGSDFFRMHQIVWVRDDVEIRSHYNDANAYSLRRVRIHVDGEYADEWVFGCFVEHPQFTNRYREYFVSAPYNVNAVEDRSTTNPIAGRFIFAPDEEEEVGASALRLVAMAESAATVSERARFSAAWVYVLARWREKSAAPYLDPVCSLSAVNKLRLCSILFGSSEFKNAVVGTFQPILDSVQQLCDRKRVALSRLAWPIRRSLHEEWVIGCVSTTNENQRITYYVSRGVEPNTIFVYFAGVDPRVIVLHNFFYNVSVVDKMYFSDASSTSMDDLV